MDIGELTINQAGELARLFAVSPAKAHSFEIGKMYLIRTVTMYYVGRIKAVTDSDLVLEDAAWVADTGRFYDALKTGEVSEVEPFLDEVIVNRGALVDATPWEKESLRKQK